MLLDLEQLVEQYSLTIEGVLHIGAHLGEESPMYDWLGIHNVVWVEANGTLINRLADTVQPDDVVIHACVSDTPNEPKVLNISNYDGLSSSLYEWGTHKIFAPSFAVIDRIPVVTTTVDQLYRTYSLPPCNMLNVDVEGGTLDVLKGAAKNLHRFDYLYLEVQTDNVWDGAPQLHEINEWLEEFDCVQCRMVENQGWGDCLWLRRTVIR